MSNGMLGMPLKIGNLVAKNRFLVQPMECCDAEPDGTPSARTFQRYAKYCAGGAGVVVVESVTLQYESRSTKNQLLLDIHDPRNRRCWYDFIHQLKILYPSTILIVQLNHAGEYSSDEFSEKVCVKEKPGFGGRVVDEAYVENVVKEYIDATEFLYGIECDGVDLKFGHGYLGSQILRPFNDRNWKYGGDWEHRSRFAFDIMEGVRKRIPDHRFLVGAKVSVVEGIVGGQGSAGPDSADIDMMESVLLCKGLEERGADFIIESLGAAQESWEMMAPGPEHPETLEMHFAASQVLRSELNPSTVVIGSGMSALGKRYKEVGELGLSKGVFDMVSIGRQVLADPDFPSKVLAERLDDINYCQLCDGCGKLLIAQKPTWCVYHRLED